MNTTEKKLLEIISKITTDEKFQTKVITLYEDYQTENLKKTRAIITLEDATRLRIFSTSLNHNMSVLMVKSFMP